MNKIKITLKQHTPLLHFQPMQDGATLRASEVKPKLDKFLLKRLGNGDYEKGKAEAKRKKWLIGDSDALNYKMKIESLDKVNIKVNDKDKKGFPFVLSNMGKKENVTDLVLYKNNTITLLFHSCKESVSLMNFISGKDCYNQNIYLLQSFFALNNFGQRTTKGFGSYTMSEGSIVIDSVKESITIEPKNSKLMPSSTPYMDFYLPNKDEYQKQYTIFSVLDFYWKVLKSGVNYTKKQYENRYIKSYLFCYLKEKKLTWEKKYLKMKFLSLDPKANNSNDNPPSFARALLGLPELYEYGNIKIQVSSSVNKGDGVIDRIASPIIFKPIMVTSGEPKVCVFILFDEELIEKIKSIPPQFTRFKFGIKQIGKEDRSTELNIDVNAVDHHELVKEYHSYLDEQEELRPDDPDNVRMVPKDYNWNNILKGTKRDYVVIKVTL